MVIDKIGINPILGAVVSVIAHVNHRIDRPRYSERRWGDVYLKSADLFLGMGKEFVKEALDMATRLSQTEGDNLFNQGDHARYFYILLKGKVKLSLGKAGPVVYIAKHPSEIIGWSSLIGRDVYSASAECLESTNLLRFDRERFLMILEDNSINQAILYKRLAEMLGNRLLELYPNIP
jgi:CRP-like cAMP-binding protein